MTIKIPWPRGAIPCTRHPCCEACEGIPTGRLQPGSVKALVEALDSVLEYEDVKPPRPDTPRWRAYTKARNALAPFKVDGNPKK